MRWLAVLAVLLAPLGGEAWARKVVIREPPIVRACPGGKSWGEVSTCIEREGKVTLERTVGKAKLVRIVQTQDGTKVDLGVYLYVEGDDKTWHIGGMFEGGEFTVTDLALLTIGKHTGYRIDVATVTRSPLSLDGVTTVPAILSLRRTLFCAGDRYGCADATTRCDVMVHGRVWLTFQGTIDIASSSEVHVLGDRSRAGDICAAQGRVFIGWPD